MAKDKSTKSAASDEFAKPSEATGGGDGWTFADDDNDGELFLITPLRKQMVNTEYGEKEVIVADIVHLNEKKPGKSEEHEEVFVFGAWLQGSLRSYIGDQRVLGRLDKAKDKTSGRGYVWKLEDADDDDIAVARAYLASIDPFAKKGKSKDDEPEPEPKKSKKSKAEPEPEPVKKKKSKK